MTNVAKLKLPFLNTCLNFRHDFFPIENDETFHLFTFPFLKFPRSIRCSLLSSPAVAGVSDPPGGSWSASQDGANSWGHCQGEMRGHIVSHALGKGAQLGNRAKAKNSMFVEILAIREGQEGGETGTPKERAAGEGRAGAPSDRAPWSRV